jgi:hypothetical protein
MGFSLSWLATKDKSPQAVLHELGFQDTGKRQAFTDRDLSAVELPSGWYLIVAEHSERVAPDPIMERLTSDSEAVTCFVEEHVMVSQAAGWKNGRRIWSVIHDSQFGLDHLDAQGELPEKFVHICDSLASKQKEEGGERAGCDYFFDIPAETAKELTGYRYDQATEHIFQVLARPKKPSIWKRLLGW